MKKNFIYGIAGFLLLFLVSFVNAQSGRRFVPPVKHAVDVAASKVLWIGKKPAGEHNGFVRLREGELLISKKEIIGGTFILDLNTIVNLDLKDEEWRNKLVGHLKSPDFFDVAVYPTAQFVITRVTRLSSSQKTVGSKATHKIEGDLTIKGITRKISFRAVILALNGRFTATTDPFIINRTLWGVNYQSRSIFAELKDQFIDDDIILSVELSSK
jgi:hypothetical protein